MKGSSRLTDTDLGTIGTKFEQTFNILIQSIMTTNNDDNKENSIPAKSIKGKGRIVCEWVRDKVEV